MNYILKLNKTPDVIAIAETKLTEGAIYTDIDISGYNFIHVNSISNAGGVGMYIKNSYSFHEIKEFDIKLDEVESIWIQIESVDKKTPIVVGTIYGHPLYIVDKLLNFSQEVEETFQKLNASKQEFYILGDFNTDLLQMHSNQYRLPEIMSIIS